jgi:hypothetical protein
MNRLTLVGDQGMSRVHFGELAARGCHVRTVPAFQMVKPKSDPGNTAWICLVDGGRSLRCPLRGATRFGLGATRLGLAHSPSPHVLHPFVKRIGEVFSMKYSASRRRK